MGVTCVLTYSVPDGKTGQQAVDMVQTKLEKLGANRTGNFSVDCETYQSQALQPVSQTQSAPPQHRLVHVLHNSEQPASCFAILDTGTYLVADTLLDALLPKLKGLYSPRRNARVESRGQRYEFGDFIIKIGSVVLGLNTSFKGILIEVEYCPCVVASECWGMISELLQSFMDEVPAIPSAHFKSKMDVVYTPVDTSMQYLEHFTNFRKTATQVQRVT